jgi:hypothetical protein
VKIQRFLLDNFRLGRFRFAGGRIFGDFGMGVSVFFIVIPNKMGSLS